MGVNIKNEETCLLASEAGAAHGRDKTGAITQALRERLERESRLRGTAARLREMRAIAERCAALVGPGVFVREACDLLYNEQGLTQ